jgi:hypothetical protein
MWLILHNIKDMKPILYANDVLMESKSDAKYRFLKYEYRN